MAERLRGALRLGVQKALGVVSMHYVVDFEQLATGYIVPDGDDDAKVNAMEQADAGLKVPPPPWPGFSKATIFLTPRTTRRRASAMRRRASRR